MPGPFGEVRQNGYVVRDLEKALAFWVGTQGVGPWFVIENARVPDFQYRGQPSAAQTNLAMAQWGALQIELIQPLDDEPSMYRDFLAAGPEGLQHVACWTDDYDATLAAALAAGFRPCQGGSFAPDARYLYFETDGHPGTVIELAETAGTMGPFFRAVAAAAEGWDGSEPIKRIALGG
jgi:catechol 2,3-dioxygenase-like lactoylglutathione lyase family enzyme